MDVQVNRFLWDLFGDIHHPTEKPLTVIQHQILESLHWEKDPAKWDFDSVVQSLNRLTGLTEEMEKKNVLDWTLFIITKRIHKNFL